MRIWCFANRSAKEMIRDPLTLCFGLGFPAVLLLLMSAIQANIPVALFEIHILAPGMIIFGLSFLTLFCATLIAKDRESAFLSRLYATPMKAVDFILGYTLPVLPIALVQALFCFLIGVCLGLDFTVGILYSLLLLMPCALLFIALGLLFGSILTQKQVGGICGALLTNLTAWLSGIWFDLNLVGGAFAKIANLLPFVHAVRLMQAMYACDFSQVLSHLLWVIGYAAVAIFFAIFLFLRQMRKG